MAARERPAGALVAPQAPSANDVAGLYDRHSEAVFRFCLRRLGSWHEAEDATQATFLNALRGLHRGVEPAAETAWLFTIAANVCRERYRSVSRRRRVETPSALDDLGSALAAPTRDGDDLLNLKAALAEMSDRQRQVIVMREWRGLSYAEIEEELGLSKSAIESLLFRARRTFAKALDHKEREGGGGPRELARARVTGVVSPVAASTLQVVHRIDGHEGAAQPPASPARRVARQPAAAPASVPTSFAVGPSSSAPRG